MKLILFSLCFLSCASSSILSAEILKSNQSFTTTVLTPTFKVAPLNKTTLTPYKIETESLHKSFRKYQYVYGLGQVTHGLFFVFRGAK